MKTSDNGERNKHHNRTKGNKGPARGRRCEKKLNLEKERRYKKEPHAEWKPVIIDEVTNDIIVPNGTMGQRWEEDVKWNLILENEDGSKIDPAMSVIDHDSKWSEVVFPYFDHQGNGTFTRSIPVK